MSEKPKIYPPVIDKIEDWPIYRLSEDRAAFIREIDEYTLNRLVMRGSDKVRDVLATTVYLERIRVKEEPWKVDPPNERQYWRRMRKQLVAASDGKNEENNKEAAQELLKKIIHRYSEEIVGTFNIKTFLFARKFLSVFFHRLLNTAANRNFRRIYSAKHKVHERLQVKGQIEAVRKLMKKGTVVVVPTHFSNLDSILIGYAMDAVMGLPSFSYGAGLNLYNTGYTAYFMNRLGAYRLDRRKKNPIYLETLKAMSTLSIQRGTNSLFFPGGTRSRSGKLEDKLKMGLLGTVVEAQRALCQENSDGKIFIVPLILSYHFVLEANYLIDQHLKRTGKEQYLDASYSRRKILKFAWQLFSESSDITLSFGQPMDVLGNPIDEEGLSYDQHGNVIDIKEYFIGKGEIKEDLQREAEYTKILAERIVERYHKDNIVLSSHLLAFSIFNIFKQQNTSLDLYALLRLPPEDYTFPLPLVIKVIEQLRRVLFAMEAEGKIKLSEQIRWELEALIKDGVRNLGNYHALKPLKFNKEGDVISEDFKVLYYYHNRLDNYQLDQYITIDAQVKPKAEATVIS
ncbi:MAG: 1-acyl-sn-glycerol-3-phosphate acyltransferase [Bacteroidota bacterium]